MSKNGLEDLAQKLEYILDRFKILDLSVKASSRLYHHQKQVAKYLHTGHDPKFDQLQHLGEATREIRELYIILEDDEFVNLIPTYKLRALLDGTMISSRDRDTLGRDIQYELLIGRLFHKSGLQVQLREPDTRCKYGRVEFSIAAKRLRSRRQLRKRVRDASKQIEGQGLLGIIALSLEQVLNPDLLPLQGSDPRQLTAQIEDDLDAFVQEHQRDLIPQSASVCAFLLTFWAWAAPEWIQDLPDPGDKSMPLELSVGWNLKLFKVPPYRTVNDKVQIIKAANLVIRNATHLAS